MTSDAGLKEIATYAAGVGPWKDTIVPVTADMQLGEATDLMARLHALGLKVRVLTAQQATTEHVYCGSLVCLTLQPCLYAGCFSRECACIYLCLASIDALHAPRIMHASILICVARTRRRTPTPLETRPATSHSPSWLTLVPNTTDSSKSRASTAPLRISVARWLTTFCRGSSWLRLLPELAPLHHPAGCLCSACLCDLLLLPCILLPSCVTQREFRRGLLKN